LEKVVQAFDKVFIVVDALDESKPRENLLRVLQTLATDARFENLRLLVTSREYIEIEDVMRDIATPISMRNYLLDQDIALYVRSKLDGHTKLRRWPPHFRDQVFEALTTKANGM
jgi:thermostable 8-oxoguanine DNA glycosylase